MGNSCEGCTKRYSCLYHEFCMDSKFHIFGDRIDNQEFYLEQLRCEIKGELMDFHGKYAQNLLGLFSFLPVHRDQDTIVKIVAIPPPHAEVICDSLVRIPSKDGELMDKGFSWGMGALEFFPKVHQEVLIQWFSPPLNWIALNTDGSVMQDSRAAGGLMRDCNGKWIIGYGCNIGHYAFSV
ncbi:hypothetical protein GH714_000375 [Hevea brasiliensis]|uniref:RNase H type-1 domain-containing protein n=1 Tax=Hevea brasiliensis TaxID=3981 RepID=A0A6A6M740_HEVBR|nr:hypothetical protein GH714_000375 [Hevea brasiliensis]